MARIQLLVGERQTREGKNAVIACNDFLRLGPGRKLTALAQQYVAVQSDARIPTRSVHTLNRWSSKYGWADRAESYDAQLEAEKNAAEQARRQQILNTGFALDYERVAALKSTANYLLKQIQEETTVTPEQPDFAEWQTITGPQNNGGQRVEATATRPNVWLRDVKQIGSGDNAERVDIVRFNAALFEQFSNYLDDIAKETGGRVQKQETHSSGTLEVTHGLADDDREAILSAIRRIAEYGPAG
jgi:hypothetical protein